MEIINYYFSNGDYACQKRFPADGQDMVIQVDSKEGQVITTYNFDKMHFIDWLNDNDINFLTEFAVWTDTLQKVIIKAFLYESEIR